MDSVSRDGSRAQLGQPNSAPAPEEPVGAAFKSYLRRLSGPGGGAIERHNYRVVQLDSVAMGVVAAATPFLPVFLARLGGSAPGGVSGHGATLIRSAAPSCGAEAESSSKITERSEAAGLGFFAGTLSALVTVSTWSRSV